MVFKPCVNFYFFPLFQSPCSVVGVFGLIILFFMAKRLLDLVRSLCGSFFFVYVRTFFTLTPYCRILVPVRWRGYQGIEFLMSVDALSWNLWHFMLSRAIP